MIKKKKVDRTVRPTAFHDAHLVEAGLDEAGRGCLAGPVFAAAVILPKDFYHKLLKDSKLMSEGHRYKLREIIEAQALAFGVGIADEMEIDMFNISNASYLAMRRAVEQMIGKHGLLPEILLIDGKYFKPEDLNIPHQCIIEGDAKFASIAAASVLAKTYRDDFMKALTPQYPDYEWAKNKGYPTQTHRSAIRRFGITPHHRQSFRLFPKAME